MHARPVRPAAALAVLSALSAAAPAVHAASVTTGAYQSYSVGLAGVSKSGSTPNSRFGYVGGNTTTSTNSTFPSFEVYEIDGSAVLNAFRGTIFNNSGTVSSISSVSIQLYDEGGTTGVAGGFSFDYATTAAGLATGNSTPVYDSTAAGGLTTQLGTTVNLGTGTYTPVTTMNSALPAYVVGTAAGDAAILADVNAGNHFYIAVSATTTTTKATVDGYFGLGTFITPPSFTFTGTAVPEPASLGLAAVGATGLLRRRRVGR